MSATTSPDTEDFTPEQLEASLEGTVATPADGMHGELVLEVDDEAFARLADLEEEVAREAAVIELAMPGDGDLEARRESELVAEAQEDVEPTLDRLLGGYADPSAGVDFGDGPIVPPARRNEFVCTGCFLIWHRRHRVDGRRDLCRDCADVPAGQAA